jgi:hypothetical protein
VKWDWGKKPILTPGHNSRIRELINMKLKIRDPEGKAQEWIMLVITLILGVILVPVVVDQIEGTSTAAWNFTGHAGAATLFMLLPFIFIVGIVVYFIGSLLGKW